MSGSERGSCLRSGLAVNSALEKKLRCGWFWLLGNLETGWYEMMWRLPHDELAETVKCLIVGPQVLQWGMMIKWSLSRGGRKRPFRRNMSVSLITHDVTGRQKVGQTSHQVNLSLLLLWPGLPLDLLLWFILQRQQHTHIKCKRQFAESVCSQQSWCRRSSHALHLRPKSSLNYDLTIVNVFVLMLPILHGRGFR